LIANWRVNVVANLMSGPAFTITNSADRTNNGGGSRPNQIADPNLPGDQRTLQRWFNTNAFALQPQFTAGNTEPGSMHGPSVKRVDLSFNKSLQMAGTQQIQLRLEIYNIFNTANFLPPNSSFGATTFGTVTSQGNYIPLQTQFAVKYLF
jgi:hypothetical protein